MILGVILSLLAVHAVLAAALLVNLLKRRFDPWAMAFWTVCIVFIPFLGAAAYALLSEDKVARRAQRRFGGGGSAPGPFQKVHDFKPELNRIDSKWRSVAEISESIGRTRLGFGNRVEVMDETEQIYSTWKRVMNEAQHHIHMLYFTFWPDETGRQFRDVLIRKAKEGVKCRVLVDSVGSHTLTGTFWEPLKEAGGEVAWFMPVAHYRRRWSIHLRNHRKLMVVDGRIGFIGSQNIDDNSHGWNPEYGKWADVCLEVRGPAVQELQRVFVKDWAYASDEIIEDEAYFEEVESDGVTPMHIVPTGPDQKERVLERILLEAFLQARESILIATPYFVPSDVFLIGLMRARLRGVRVRIVLPSLTDMPIVLHAGRSYYPQLLDEGVEVCEFNDGMLHSKVVTVDGTWALTGSANMDLRSFRTNFEISALIYDSHVVSRLTRILEEYCTRAKIIRREDLEAKKLRTQLLEGAARLFAPQL